MTKKFILNEQQYAKDILEDTSSPTDFATLQILAGYYHSLGYDSKEIFKLISDYVIRRNPSASLVMLDDMLHQCVASAQTRKLLVVDHIDITEAEMNVVRSAQSTEAPLSGQRLAFTALCLSKYHNLRNEKNDNWVSTPYRDIFTLSNIALTKLRQGWMMGILVRAGFFRLSNIVSSTTFQVLYANPEGSVAMQVSDFRNLGNQYMRYWEPNRYIECQECGLVVKRHANNHKYCHDCSEKMNAKRALQRYRVA